MKLVTFDIIFSTVILVDAAAILARMVILGTNKHTVLAITYHGPWLQGEQKTK